MKIARWAAAVLGLCVLAACEEGHSHDDNPGDHHDLTSEACQEIMDVCHDVDIGEGEIVECHDIAHEDVHEDCVAEQDRCISLCEAAAADGGEHHDEDGGHEDS